MRAKNIDGLVVKVTENSIVLLCANGTFRNVPLNSSDQVPMLGQQFSYTEKKRSYSNLLRYASIASVLILTILAFTFIQLGDKSAAYIVAMDINPSIEIILDKNLTVQDIYGLNNEGKIIIESIDVANQHLFIVAEKIIETAKEKGYLQSQEKALVSITVVPLDEGLEPLELDIEKELNRSLKNNGINSDSVVTQGSKELYQEAKELNFSINKLKLYKELYGQGIVQSPEEIRDKTIRQIREMGKETPQRNNGNNNGQFNSEKEQPNIPSLPGYKDQVRDNNDIPGNKEKRSSNGGQPGT